MGVGVATGTGALRVLLVEDHSDTLDVVARLLRTEGCTVIKAAGYCEALALAELQAFDLLIADLEMPDGTGWDLLGELRQRLGDNAFDAIAVSAHAFPQAVEKSRRAGFCRHLSKPISFAQLTDAIRSCTRRR